jgi:hypothetical protein
VVSPKVGPPFAEIAKGSRAAPEALRDFLHSTHSDVGHPGATTPNPALTERQIDEIVAYLGGQGADLLETRGWDDLASGVIEASYS